MKHIDTSIWVTQQALANDLKISVQAVHNWVNRDKIDWQKLPGSKIILVNKNTISIDTQHHKHRNRK